MKKDLIINENLMDQRVREIIRVEAWEIINHDGIVS